MGHQHAAVSFAVAVSGWKLRPLWVSLPAKLFALIINWCQAVPWLLAGAKPGQGGGWGKPAALGPSAPAWFLQHPQMQVGCGSFQLWFCGDEGFREQTDSREQSSLCRTLPAAGAQAVLVLGWSRQPGTIQLKITPVNKTLPPGLARWSGGTESWDVPGCGSTVGLAPCRGALGWCHQLQACPSALSTPLPSSWGHSGPWHPHCRQQNVTSACWRAGSPADVVMAHSSGMPQPPHAELCAGCFSTCSVGLPHLARVPGDGWKGVGHGIPVMATSAPRARAERCQREPPPTQGLTVGNPLHPPSRACGAQEG